MKTLALLLLLAGDGGTPDAGHQHCWHMSDFQHAVSCHSDEVCCRCGESVCRHIEGCGWRFRQPGHGPYVPGAVMIEIDGGAVYLK